MESTIDGSLLDPKRLGRDNGLNGKPLESKENPSNLDQINLKEASKQNFYSNQDLSADPLQSSNDTTNNDATDSSKKDVKDFNKDLNELDRQRALEFDHWKDKYSRLLDGYRRLQTVNQKLEDKLLDVVDGYEKEKSTLMADVNKLSSKLVDARIKLHDMEERQILHASECDAECHKTISNLASRGYNGSN